MPIRRSLIECLFHHEVSRPDHDAIVTPAGSLSYAQLAGLVRRQVARLEQAGISEQSVVGIRCADEPRHLLLNLAAAHIGATSCTLPTYETDAARDATITQCGVTHVLDESMGLEMTGSGNGAPASATERTLSPGPAAQAVILFSTSGTTGDPKLVIHLDRDLVAQAHRHIESRRERFACLASIEHNFAKRHRLYCLAVGASNVFVDVRGESLVAQCRSLDINVLHVSAFQSQELLARPDIGQLSDIRLKLGGSHVPITLRQQLRHGITRNLQAGYGTTETGAIAFTDPNDSNAGESVGQPLPGIEIRAVATDGRTLKAGEHGELAVRCDGLFRGYLGKPELTAARLVDGWFYTGDIGYLDDRQRIHVCGRSDDMFVFNSMNIYPQDIEAQICQHPDVTDAAVLPRTSPVHGDIPVALVVFDSKATPDLASLRKFVQQRVGLRSPRQYTIVDAIPRTESGKLSRGRAIGLTREIDEIRAIVARTLESIDTVDLNPGSIAAFERGDIDITMREFELDSLASMEFLVALEINCNTVISPQRLGEFRSLGEIVGHVVSVSGHDIPQPQLPAGPLRAPIRLDDPPGVIRLFRRVFRICPTVAQLNKALATLEHRLTPTEMACLYQWHGHDKLLPESAAGKFRSAFGQWLNDMQRMLTDSGKPAPEPYSSQRIAPTVTLFAGPGSPADKTLLVCFSLRGGRHLMMPNAVLLQHTDSSRFDVLVIAEPLKQGYMQGVPLLGGNLDEVVDWIAKLDWIGDYHRIRTVGCSAGGFAAVIAGYRLGAETAVCIGGRFHSERYPMKILHRILATWKAVRTGHCSNVLISYATDKSRDRVYAKVIGWLCRGHLLGVEFTDGKVGHAILRRVVERGDLVPYFAKTVFAETDDVYGRSKRGHLIMSFPGLEIRTAVPAGQNDRLVTKPDA